MHSLYRIAKFRLRAQFKFCAEVFVYLRQCDLADCDKHRIQAPSVSIPQKE